MTNALTDIRADGGLLFPADLDCRNRRFHFMDTTRDALRSATFLDNRFFGADTELRPVGLDELRGLDMPQAARTGLLFHTSFCCSTLLARLLDFPGRSLALKEPLVLRRLSDAALAGPRDLELTAMALKLLFRPVDGSSAVLVKPTHVALNIADELLSHMPGTRALLITSTLEDFMISNIKKPETTQRKVPELVERFMAEGGLAARLPAEALEPPSLLAAVALQWHAQRQLLLDLQRGRHGPALQVIEESDLLRAPEATLRAALDWLGWPCDDAGIAAQTAAVMRRHAKSGGRDYDPQEKAYETGLLRDRYRDELRQALAWSERLLRPCIMA